MLGIGIALGETSAAGIALPSVSGNILQVTGDSVAAGLLASWTDLSGAGNTMTASGGLRPTVSTNVKNGHAAVTFSGSNLMTAPVIAGSAFTMLCAIQITTVQVQDAFSNGAFGANGFSAGSGATNRAFQRLGFATDNDGAATTAWEVWAVTMTTSALGFYLNNVNQSLSSAAVAAPSSGNLTVGGLNNGASFVGKLAEVLLYNSALSAGNIATLSRYLGTKYGITVA